RWCRQYKYGLISECLSADGTGAVAMKQDFGTSCWKLGDCLNIPASRVQVWLGRRKGCTNQAEQPSQTFRFLGSPKLVRHVRCYPNSGQIVAVPRLSALCHSRPMHRSKSHLYSIASSAATSRPGGMVSG